MKRASESKRKRSRRLSSAVCSAIGKHVVHNSRLPAPCNYKTGWVYHEAARDVILLAVSGSWAMVRRPKCAPYCCPLKEIALNADDEGVARAAKLLQRKNEAEAELHALRPATTSLTMLDMAVQKFVDADREYMAALEHKPIEP